MTFNHNHTATSNHNKDTTIHCYHHQCRMPSSIEIHPSITTTHTTDNSSSLETFILHHHSNDEATHQHQDPPQHSVAIYNTSLGTMTEDSIEVYAPSFQEVFIIPKRDIVHMPDADVLMKVNRLILCANFQAHNPERYCRKGRRCHFVHANLGRALNQRIHMNFAWRSLSEVAFERFDESLGLLEVAPPNGALPELIIPAHCVLKTKAIDDPRRPVSHCAHYYYSRACNRGPECSFIHAVYLDPTAQDHQRAPAPSRDRRGLNTQYPPIVPMNTKNAQLPRVCSMPRVCSTTVGSISPFPESGELRTLSPTHTDDQCSNVSRNEPYGESMDHSFASATAVEDAIQQQQQMSSDSGLPLSMRNGEDSMTHSPNNSTEMFSIRENDSPLLLASPSKVSRFRYDPYSFAQARATV